MATQLVETARRGDDFVDAYQSMFHVAFRVAYRLLGDHAEAEDIAQEACIRASSRWTTLRQGDYAAPWIVRVAGNLAIDRFRRVARARRLVELRDEPTVAMPGERIDLHRALDQLPMRQREVIILRYFADLTERQVADVLRCQVGTVKSHAFRALSTLRKVIDIGEE